MELKLIREQYADSFTQGKLYVNNALFCSTLEPGRYLCEHPCIPTGRYNLSMRFSPHFKAQRPWLHNVPSRQYILIHEGNHAKDSQGCILVGTADPEVSGVLLRSKVTLKHLIQEITTATNNNEEVWITIE